MIESADELNIKELFNAARTEDSFDDEKFNTLLDAVLQEKLNLTLVAIKQPMIEWIKNHAEELSLELPNIAPRGDYGQFIEDNEGMTEFLKTKVAQLGVWYVNYIGDYEGNKHLIKFNFFTKEVNDGDTLSGMVFVSKSGVIRHAFVSVNT